MNFKLLLLLFSAFLLSACATTGKYEEKLQSWVGSNEADLVRDWGPPNSVYTLTGGGKILTYTRSTLPQSKTTYDATDRSLNTSSAQYICTTNFTVDGGGKITTWRWEGNACRST